MISGRRRSIAAVVLGAGILSAAAWRLRTGADSADPPVPVAQSEIESAQPEPAPEPAREAEALAPDPRAGAVDVNAETTPATGHRATDKKRWQVRKPAARNGAPVVKTPGTRPSLLSGLPTLQAPSPRAGTGSSSAAAGPGLEAMAIQRTVRKYSPAVRQDCWQPALNARASSVSSSAKISAAITVDASGRVQSVTASGAPSGYPGLAHCIEQAVRGWTFPRSGGETLTHVPFVFVGQ